MFENCLFLLRVKQHIQGEYDLKFWLKNIHEFQSCCIPCSWFHLLPNKNRSFYLVSPETLDSTFSKLFLLNLPEAKKDSLLGMIGPSILPLMSEIPFKLLFL